MMTRRERLGKRQVLLKLREGGYPTYGELFDLFDLHLTEDPGVIGYMEPGEAVICVNSNLNIEQVSMVVRHEILHEFLEHKKRLDKIGDPMSNIANIAADYEISDVGYTEEDKQVAKNINVGDQVFQGLVVELDRPDLVGKTFEEMYEILKKESPQSSKQPQIGDRGDKSIQEAENAKRRAEAIAEAADDAGQDSQGSETSDSGSNQSGKEKSGSPGGSGKSDSGETGEEGSGSSGGDEKDSQDKGKSASGKKRNKYDDDDYKNMSPEEKKKERARRRKEAAKKQKEEAEKIIEDIEEVLGDKEKQEESGKVFETPEEQKEREERVKQIKKALSDLQKAQQAIDESKEQVQKDVMAKAAKDSRKYRDSPLVRFTESINRFIRNELARGRNSSWAHINKKYVNSGLLKPGYSYSSRNEVPSINVYFDRSGSWDKAKTEEGRKAIATLDRYVTRGELKINLFYFNTQVLDTDPGGTGGTRGEPILEHIVQTNPDNVIVLTDNDISDCRTKVQVKGGVWFLWYGGTHHNQIADYLSGAKYTGEFEVE